MIYSLEEGIHGRSRRYRHGRTRRFYPNNLFGIALVIFTAGTGFMTVAAMQSPETAKLSAQTQTETPPAPVAILPTEAVVAAPRFNNEKIQSVISNWSAKYPNASVVVADKSGAVLGEAKSHTPYFMASIYKLYVAYAGYQAIESGVMNGNEVFVRGLTREQCLDEMVRNSDSTCAERILAELTKPKVQAKLVELGLTNTSMAGLTTSARDTSVMLAIIQRGEGLSSTSHQKLLASMQGQKYRNALPKGFSGLTVYNKVGFRELVEYHDVGIVSLADGTPLVVSVLSKNTGNRNIAQLAMQLIQATQPE